MNQHRPLFKHIRDHDALFAELAILRNTFADYLGFSTYEFNKVPKFILPNGSRLTIEPERSIVVPSYTILKGVKRLLESSIKGFKLIEKSDIGFRYPTAATAGLNAPFIKRFRSEFFHNSGEDRNICRPLNLSYGIKSRGKADNRQEYEVWVPEENLAMDPSPLFIEKYGEDLPDQVREFATLEPTVHGWMGVKRSAFEAMYIDHDNSDIVINLALSVDVYNIGARPDLSYSSELASSIAVSNAELEWEVMGYYSPKGVQLEQEQIWQAINNAIEALSQPLNNEYGSSIIASKESKTERILSTIASLGISDDAIADWNLKPWEFLQTQSEYRKKHHDPSRSVNLLGRLNRLFYQESHQLPSLKEIHDFIM